ncbi:flagellar biosynthesis anti-sigma factor FlgM [Novosphingobium sp. 1949]|uniref:Flagellar biosynthesis anti-sigma factor FlgM n=1 Tax=Novosphingobium organovorum TaxID=2930092 RepID=A0ABT0BJB3_9SPHN|nr:flagellar biosynthesis anti-sigma factor FlgM [Novosphingobium organovorum]MCJ2184938.1 flagellar biosynthesis anti-sigma factor FlgM [Novosphingobium organovorum]
MPPIEVGPAQSIGSISARVVRTSGGEELSGVQASTPVSVKTETTAAQSQPTQTPASPSVETSAALDPGEAPVDTDRVATIRKAVEDGHYPLVPTQIADAMIAAGVLLRSPK